MKNGNIGKKTSGNDRGESMSASGPVKGDSRSGPLIYPGMEDVGIGMIRSAPGTDEYGEPPDSFGDEFEDPEDFPDPENLPRRGGRGPYLFISIFFALIFVLLMGHLVHFNIYEKDSILNSPYNRRQNAQADRVVRGSIKSIDGATLAYTEVYEDGSEERFYPYANIFAHTVGFITHGKSGLESIANYELLTAHNNIIDQIINEFRHRKNPGDTVVTTMNADLQEACYYALGDYRGAIVVLDVKTGAVKAMVSRPNFDPNTLADIWDEMVADSSNSQLLNRATQGLYPPGSTFKIVTALAYLRRYGTFDNFSYNCTGEFEVDDSVVHCYKGTVHGEEDFSEAFAHSCNTAFSQIGLMLKANRLTDAAKDLMFGEKMPGELYISRTRWQLTSSSDDVELVQTAFGQGKTLTTPYHMAILCAAIANRGVAMTPYLIDHVENRQGTVISRSSPSRYRRIMSEDEAASLTSLMREVVENGTAAELSGRSWKVAGKTGSAEYYLSDGSIGTHSWFVGFTNPDDPDIAIAVLAENGGAGSSTAVPIASAVLESYYGY